MGGMTRARRAAPWRFRWVGIAYLLLVVGVAVFVYLTTWGWLQEPGDASFAGIWLIFVAFPGSLILLSVSTDGMAAFALHVAVGLVQAAVLLGLCWWLDRRLATRG